MFKNLNSFFTKAIEFFRENKDGSIVEESDHLVPSPPVVNGIGVSVTSDNLAISQYSEFPRYYNIDGVVYDIDNPDDIKNMPLIRNVLNINGKSFGMDTILNEFYYQCPDRSLGYIAYDKCMEFRKNGILHKSERELNMDTSFEAWEQKKSERMHQCDTFTVDDMQQFPDIPIAWSYVMQLQHTNGIAWCQLNLDNQEIVKGYIAQVNDIILDAHSYVDGICDSYIDLDSINFDYPTPMYKNCMCCTRIECYPYTPTGKLSKYPVIIHFQTKPNTYGICTSGEIKVLRDGSIGAATASVYGDIFKIGLHGTSLVLKRVDNVYKGGNLFYFPEKYE